MGDGGIRQIAANTGNAIGILLLDRPKVWCGSGRIRERAWEIRREPETRMVQSDSGYAPAADQIIDAAAAITQDSFASPHRKLINEGAQEFFSWIIKSIAGFSAD